MIFKLFRYKYSQQYLSLEEIFHRGLAFMQNWSSLPSDIELIANTPEDIRQLTLEMLSCSFKKKFLSMTGTPLEIQKKYADLARDYETFSSSRFSESFIAKYPEVFTFDKQKSIKFSNESTSPMPEQVSAMG
jgi:hypothetical protein